MLRKIPLIFSPQPESGFTVTSPILPELVTEGNSLEEAYANVADALSAVIELYAEQKRPLPSGVELPVGQVVWSERWWRLYEIPGNFPETWRDGVS